MKSQKEKEITLKREYFDRLVRNAKRLERLASAILDITKIDDESLRLNKEYFSLKETVLDLVQDHKGQLEKSDGKTKVLYDFKIGEEEKIPNIKDIFIMQIKTG